MNTLRDDIAEIGGYRELFGTEFIISAIFSTIIAIVMIYTDVTRWPDLGVILISFITVSGAILGLIITAFSLILSLSGDKNFQSAFFKGKFYTTIEVDFSWTAILIGVCILSSIVSIFVIQYDVTSISVCLFAWSLFTFLWVVINVIMLASNSIRMLCNLKEVSIDDDDS